MSTYQKIPLIVEAEQYLDGKIPQAKGVCLELHDNVSEPHVHTIHDNQIVILEDGDWILEEPDGIHYYPIKSNIFDKSYKEVFKID